MFVRWYLARRHAGGKLPPLRGAFALTIVKGPAAILNCLAKGRVWCDADYYPELPIRRRLHHGAVGSRRGQRNTRTDDDAARRRTRAARGALALRAAARRSLLIPALAFILLTSANGALVAQTAQPECHPPQQTRQVADLFFGRDIAGKPGVSEAAWARFVAR